MKFSAYNTETGFVFESNTFKTIYMAARFQSRYDRHYGEDPGAWVFVRNENGEVITTL